jgi:hypothetical protein
MWHNFPQYESSFRRGHRGSAGDPRGLLRDRLPHFVVGLFCFPGILVAVFATRATRATRAARAVTGRRCEPLCNGSDADWCRCRK